MKNSKKEVMNAEIDKGLEEYIESMSEKYPGQDIELIVTQNLLKKQGANIRQSEVDHFKKLAISSLGTDNEIKFDDAERGFLKAALADGKAGFKEFIESIPVEAPICDDGTKMRDCGIEKKNLMTAMGLIEGVGRTRYRDVVANKNAYPLDDKIGLQIVGGNRSRYTNVLSQNAARLYAELTEESAVETLRQLLFIDLEKASLSQIGQAVSSRYALQPMEAEAYSALADKQAKAAMIEANEACESGNGAGFLSQRLEALDGDPDRDAIIEAAIKGKLEGVESDVPAKSVLYVLADGTGVPGRAKELSPEGKNGDKAKTFEAKIGCSFRQEFSEEGLPILDNGDIKRVPDTTKYIGTTGKIDIFGPLLAAFLAIQGFLDACQIVFLGDGASWIWKLQQSLCPNAICIIDFFHATENLNKIIDMLRIYGSRREAFRRECHRLLELGDIAKLVSRISEMAPPTKKEEIVNKLDYFTENADKMRYGLFRAAGLFIGSGVVEAACKTIVGKRMKNAGMHWSKKNAEGVIALRCAIHSDEYGSADPPSVSMDNAA